MDCFLVGRLQGTKGSVWQLTAIDIASSFAWAELVTCPRGNPTGAQTSKLARRVARELRAAGWQLERVITDNGGEFRSADFRSTLDDLILVADTVKDSCAECGFVERDGFARSVDPQLRLDTRQGDSIRTARGYAEA